MYIALENETEEDSPTGRAVRSSERSQRRRSYSREFGMELRVHDKYTINRKGIVLQGTSSLKYVRSQRISLSMSTFLNTLDIPDIRAGLCCIQWQDVKQVMVI